MCKIVGNIEPCSFWPASKPSAAQLEMSYVCTEACILYGKRKFITELEAGRHANVRGRRPNQESLAPTTDEQCYLSMSS